MPIKSHRKPKLTKAQLLELKLRMGSGHPTCEGHCGSSQKRKIPILQGFLFSQEATAVNTDQRAQSHLGGSRQASWRK